VEPWDRSLGLFPGFSGFADVSVRLEADRGG